VPGGYRLGLYQLLTNAGINAVLVGTSIANSAPGLAYPQHDGFGGYEIGDIAASYQTYKAGLSHAPDWILLQCGLNDFRHNHAITTATNRLESLIVQICTNFAGVIYAPEAYFMLNGGAPVNFIGSSITGNITVNGHVFFHYDEFLMNFWPYF